MLHTVNLILNWVDASISKSSSSKIRRRMSNATVTPTIEISGRCIAKQVAGRDRLVYRRVYNPYQ